MTAHNFSKFAAEPDVERLQEENNSIAFNDVSADNSKTGLGATAKCDPQFISSTGSESSENEVNIIGTQNNDGNGKSWKKFMNVTEKAVTPINRQVILYICELCNKEFTKIHIMKQHLFTFHKVQTVQSNHQCSVCKNYFFKGRNLRNHLRRYHKIRSKHLISDCESNDDKSVELASYQKLKPNAKASNKTAFENVGSKKKISQNSCISSLKLPDILSAPCNLKEIFSKSPYSTSLENSVPGPENSVEANVIHSSVIPIRTNIDSAVTTKTEQSSSIENVES